MELEGRGSSQDSDVQLVKERHLIQKLVLSNPWTASLVRYEHLHLDYCKDLPTASSSLKACQLWRERPEAQVDRVTLSLHPDSGPQHKL